MFEELENCLLCPRACGVNRNAGKRGYCNQTTEVKVARVAPHYWEEPCISGEKGSGAVFFSGCNLRCVYCQNAKIAAGSLGRGITSEELSDAFLKLQEEGCHNINLVTPSHYVLQIARALTEARKRGLTIPVVYNTSSYDCVQSLRLLEGLVDIYLADLKYVSAELSARYSHAVDYPEVAKAALAEMVRQTGGICYELPQGGLISEAEEYPDGALMKKGVIVRHLLLPGQVEEAKRVLDYLYGTYKDRIAVSIMNQYTPLLHVQDYPELSRKVTEEEYEEVLDYAVELGIGHGFLQEGDTAEESFIPEFEGE